MMRSPAIVALGLATLLLACSDPADPRGGTGDAAVSVDAAVTDGAGDGALPGDAVGGLPQFRRCTGRSYTPAAAAGFATVGGRIAAASGAAVHAVNDPIAPPGSAPAIAARLAYGAAALTQEPVAVSIDDCTGWQGLGTVMSDRNGVAAATVGLPLGPGVYEVAFDVRGDASVVRGFLWLAPVGTHLVVTDIDGTLTISDNEILTQIINPSYVPQSYPSAPELTAAHVGKGALLVYLTGRAQNLTAQGRTWLTTQRYAAGALRASPTTTLPTDGSVGDFKKAELAALVSAGYAIDLAYGNATTDIYAYTGAGIAADRQWIIGTNGGDGGTHAVADSWAARVAEVAASAPVAQPFMP